MHDVPSIVARLLGEWFGVALGILLCVLVVSFLIWFVLVVWRKGILPEWKKLNG